MIHVSVVWLGVLFHAAIWTGYMLGLLRWKLHDLREYRCARKVWRIGR